MSSLVTWWRYTKRKVREVTAYVVVTNSGVSITSPAYNGSVTRASIALQFNHATSAYTQVSSGQDRCQHDVYGNDGQWHLNQRLAGEPQRTNSALYSCTPGSWTNASTLGIAAASASCIPGQTAYVITNVSSTTAALTQVIGTFGTAGAVRSDRIVVEQGTGTKTALQVYDATATAALGKIVLTWAGLSIATTGTVTASNPDVLGVGPNGGTMVGFWLTTTSTSSGTGKAGNSFRLDFIPSGGVSDTATTIWHHIQDELGLFPSTPIVTGAGTNSRNAEIVTVPIPASATPTSGLSAYAKYVDLGISLATGCPLTLGNLGSNMSAAPYCSSVGHITGFTQDSAGNTERTNPVVSGNYGDLNEVRLVVAPTGTALLGVAVNAGVEATNGPTAAPASWTGPWHDATVHLNVFNGGQGAYALGTFILAAATPAAPSLAQFRSM